MSKVMGVTLTEKVYEWLRQDAEDNGGASISSRIRFWLEMARQENQPPSASEAYVNAVRQE